MRVSILIDMLFRKRRIYADAAAATPLSARAKKELVRHLAHYGNPGALHKEAQAAKGALEQARATVARAIGAHPDEIVFTASGTEANNLAILGTLRPRLVQGDKVSAVTIAVEHQSVLAPLQALGREGMALAVAAVGPDGVVHPSAVADAMDQATALVSVQLVNSEVGAIQPVHDIAKSVRRGSVRPLLHVDASQAPLWMDIKVEALGADLLTLDAQKIMGPKGVGCLYIKRGTLIDPIVWGGGQEGGKRAGTENAPLCAAFAVALADAQAGAAKRAKKVAAVRDYLWQEIKKVLPDAILHGPQGKARVANNLNLSIPGLDAQMCTVAMDAEGVAVSTRSACATDDDEPSYVLLAMGIDTSVAKEAVRITVLPDISYRQARRIAAALHEVAKRYKRA